jgi:alkanesulfonate monooxygenase SsuD/methylene tetrahydromethanopterin reductase-like flavin-dependent oxidoreductase (luciferase family)
LEENGLVGTPEQAIEKLRPWRDAGAGYVIGYFPDAAYDGSSVDLFAKAVMPNL